MKEDIEEEDAEVDVVIAVVAAVAAEAEVAIEVIVLEGKADNFQIFIQKKNIIHILRINLNI